MKVLFSFLFCLTLLPAYTQSSLLKDLNFQTAYEERILLDPNASNLELFMAFGKEASDARTLNVKSRFDSFIAEIKSSKIMRYPEAKLIKTLHKNVHDEFLKTYKLVSPFHEIFETGHYNCVSATALFALVLGELNIPFNIQEQPNHVYIMAYPKTLAISVEMTAKEDASFMPNRKNVSQAVQALLRLGLIDRTDLNLKSEVDIYNHFYNYNGEITVKELVGIQYFNEAIVLTDNENYKDAYETIKKAEKFYRFRKTKIFKSELLFELLDEAKYDRLVDFQYLIDYANLEKKESSYVHYVYGKFLYEHLNEKGERPFVDSSFNLINNAVTDSTLKKELKGFYYLSYSDYYNVKGNQKKRLDFAEQAYLNNPLNIQIQSVLSRSILAYFSDKYQDDERFAEMDDEDEFDVVKEADLLLKNLDEYAKKYPFLLTDDTFQSGYFILCSEMASELYMDDEEKPAKAYFDLAVKIYKTLEEKESVFEDSIGWLFAEAGAYLAREHRYDEALEILNEGLKYSPDHERILARIEIVKSRMKSK